MPENWLSLADLMRREDREYTFDQTGQFCSSRIVSYAYTGLSVFSSRPVYEIRSSRR